MKKAIFVLLMIVGVLNTRLAYCATYDEGIAGMATVLDDYSNADIEYNYKLMCPLDIDLQSHLIDKCNEIELNPDYVFVLLQIESGFNTNARHINTNGSIDRGMAQINSKYETYYEDRYDLNIDPFNPYDAIDFAVSRINDEREFWDGKVTIDKMIYCIFGSYNMGRGGYKNYIRNGIYGYSYTDKVIKAINSY